VSVPVQAAKPLSSPATNTVLTPPQSKWAQMQSILATQNDIPIDFYGRVIDQFGNSVANATVNFSVSVYNGYESTEKRGQVITDDKGFFTITGYKGQDLGVMPKKTGYVLATTGTLFKYSHLENHPYVSDRNNPTVIKMWKLQGSEPLVDIAKEYKISYTSQPIYFDLAEKKIVQSGGDLKITVNRPDGIISASSGMFWEFFIERDKGPILRSGRRYRS
jgi:hypothetical protein